MNSKFQILLDRTYQNFTLPPHPKIQFPSESEPLEYTLAYVAGFEDKEFFSQDFEARDMQEAESQVEQYYHQYKRQARKIAKAYELDDTPSVLCWQEGDYERFGDALQDYLDQVVAD
jgi:hypothetical protein